MTREAACLPQARRTSEELGHDLVAVLQRQGQHADGRADREAASDPVPEAEDVLSADAKRGRSWVRAARGRVLYQYDAPEHQGHLALFNRLENNDNKCGAHLEYSC
jgi:hypothetical protein